MMMALEDRQCSSTESPLTDRQIEFERIKVMRKVFITTFTIAMTTALLMGCGNEDSEKKVLKETASTVTVGEASEETKNTEAENPGMTDTASIGGRLESDETNVGDGMPAFTTTDLDGNEVTNDIFAKKDLTVLNVWGTFCGPCIEEMPELGAWAKELPENVQLIGFVSDIADLNDEDAVYMAKTIAEEANADFPQLIGGGADFSDFMSGIIGVPTTFFIDRNGNFIGEPIVGAYVEQYKENVKNYLAEMGK